MVQFGKIALLVFCLAIAVFTADPLKELDGASKMEHEKKEPDTECRFKTTRCPTTRCPTTTSCLICPPGTIKVTTFRGESCQPIPTTTCIASCPPGTTPIFNNNGNIIACKPNYTIRPPTIECPPGSLPVYDNNGNIISCRPCPPTPKPPIRCPPGSTPVYVNGVIVACKPYYPTPPPIVCPADTVPVYDNNGNVVSCRPLFPITPRPIVCPPGSTAVYDSFGKVISCRPFYPTPKPIVCLPGSTPIYDKFGCIIGCKPIYPSPTPCPPTPCPPTPCPPSCPRVAGDCPKNEKFFKCGPGDSTCEVKKPVSLVCLKEGCYCIERFVRNASNVCIDEFYCKGSCSGCGNKVATTTPEPKANHKCGVNEVYMDCGECENICGKAGFGNCRMQTCGRPGCYCPQKTHSRGYKNGCVRSEYCSDDFRNMYGFCTSNLTWLETGKCEQYCIGKQTCDMTQLLSGCYYCPPFTTKKPVTCKTKPPTKPPTKPTKPTIKPPTIPPCEYNKIYYPYCGYVEEFCRNPPRDFEIHVCPPPGCYCPKNFALDDYGVCIPRSLCPTTPCPPTECPTTCPTTCPTEVPTCEPETTTTPCPFQCEPNCIYLEYGICEATCDNLKPEVTAVRLPAGCYCPPAGFARDCDNNCIPVSDCP
uniref:TIL domain-containing protein n=1 Tax=Rhabditophanes sp. KR3021 TaxID=114890 RepID=A0AC35TTU6_9BILA